MYSCFLFFSIYNTHIYIYIYIYFIFPPPRPLNSFGVVGVSSSSYCIRLELHCIWAFDLVGVFRSCRSFWSLSELSAFSELLEFSELSEFFLIFVIIVIKNRILMISILKVLFKKNLDERPFFQFGLINFCGNSFVNFAYYFFSQLTTCLTVYFLVISFIKL